MSASDNRHRLGLIFVGSSTLMFLVALSVATDLFGMLGLFSMDATTRYIVGGALAVGGVVELVLGVRFLGGGS